MRCAGSAARVCVKDGWTSLSRRSSSCVFARRNTAHSMIVVPQSNVEVCWREHCRQMLYRITIMGCASPYFPMTIAEREKQYKL
jgi:hypothetical protein